MRRAIILDTERGRIYCSDVWIEDDPEGRAGTVKITPLAPVEYHPHQTN